MVHIKKIFPESTNKVKGIRWYSNKECVRAKLLQSCPTLCDSMDHSL